MNKLDQLTLVMLTYNRPFFLKRSLHYWSKVGVTVHILDGSDVPFDKNYPFPSQIHYHHHPVSFHKRIGKALDLVTTPYVAFIADDQFSVPSAIINCLSFLDQEQTYVSCIGICWNFTYQSQNVCVRDLYPEHHGYAVDQETGIERMNYHFSPYVHSTFYSITRTLVWKKCFLAYAKKEFPVYALAEIEFELLNAYLGKSKVLNELMLFKSDETESLNTNKKSILSNISLDKKNKLTDWWTNKNNVEDKEVFLTLMAESAEENIEKQRIFKKALASLMDTHPYQSEQIGFFRNIFLKVTTKLPYTFKQRIKYHMLTVINIFSKKKKDFFLGFYQMSKIDFLIQESLQNGLKIDVKEVENIVNTIRDSYAKKI